MGSFNDSLIVVGNKFLFGSILEDGIYVSNKRDIRKDPTSGNSEFLNV